MDSQESREGPDPRPTLHLDDPASPGSPDNRGRRRRSLFRRTLHGVGWLSAAPADWMGWRSITGGATLLERFFQRTRGRAQRDRRFKTGEERVFDVVGTAFAYGVTVEEVERRLAVRRRQTAILAYVTFGIGCISVLAWASVALRVAGAGERVILLVEFLPFCLLFYLMSFYQALINFQIRVGRAAGWRAYLSTEEGFLPRC